MVDSACDADKRYLIQFSVDDFRLGSSGGCELRGFSCLCSDGTELKNEFPGEFAFMSLDEIKACTDYLFENELRDDVQLSRDENNELFFNCELSFVNFVTAAVENKPQRHVIDLMAEGSTAPEPPPKPEVTSSDIEAHIAEQRRLKYDILADRFYKLTSQGASWKDMFK